MSDEAAFLRAIAADPGDDTARLAFADWLDDRADFRGAFVRAGVAFDRTPPNDPERFRLAARLRAMFRTPEFKSWLPEREWPSTQEKRPALDWLWLGRLTLWAHLHSLEAEDLLPGVADRLTSGWVERAIFETRFPDLPPSWMPTFDLARFVRELWINGGSYGPDMLARLRDWPYLRKLRISGLLAPWTDLAALPHLRALALHVPDQTVAPDPHRARLPDLEALHMSRRWEGDLPDWGGCFPKLRSLTLTDYNGYSNEQCERFAACPHLRHLALGERQPPLTRVELKALTRAAELRSLSLGPVPQTSVGALAALPHLEHLHTEGRAGRIRGLEALTGLRWLSLKLEKLTKSIAAQICLLPRLARLDLTFLALEDGALTVLDNAQSLRVLTIYTGYRSGESLQTAELMRLSGLKYLRASNRLWTEQELADFRVALPDCLLVINTKVDEDDEYDWG